MNWKKVYNHLMSGVSYFLPFVVGGGIMLACAYLFDFQNATEATFGASNAFVAWLNQIGGLAMGFMFPVMGAYIAYSIADRPGLLVGMVAGSLAASGGSSFLGAVAGGFAAGYIILGLKKLTAKMPRSLEGIKTLLIFPIVGLAITSFSMLAINAVVAPITGFLTGVLSNLSGANAALLGAIIGVMLALDLGGPINKTAYLFSVATLTSAAGTTVPSVTMAACGCSAMVISTACGVACTLFPKKFSESLRGAKLSAYIMGLAFFVEGAIPFVADRPKKILPSLCVGAAVTGALVGALGITLQAPIGGLETILLVSNIPLYLLCFVIGTAVAVAMIYVLIRNEPDQE
ncbi:MAG: PTS fructose transporter subunit IIC [Erysipelotrichaceae bacterium]|nr:PTS fructose transporter subunit IIC [Erysipelotrichaceae bacterium]